MRSCLLLAVLAALAGAAPAHAYKLNGKAWPGRAITYHAHTPQYADALATAVRAWNTSGARIRFKAVASPRRAQLRIVEEGRRTGPAGRATLGYATRRTVVQQTVAGIPISGDVGCGDRVRVPGKGMRRIRCVLGPHVWLARVAPELRKDPYHRNQMVIVAAHELGHVLGLGHSKRTCAAMSYEREEVCPKPAGVWQERCRPLERDDVAGAIRRYGGRMKPLAPEFCDSYPPPPAPAGLTAGLGADGQLVVAWAEPPPPGAAGVRINVSADECNTGWGLEAEGGVFEAHYMPGRYCVTAWSVDGEGRPGPSVSAWVELPGEPPAEDPFTPAG